MDKFVGVRLQIGRAVVFLLARAAIDTSAVLPGVRDTLVADIPLGSVKPADRKLAVRVLAAINAAAGE